MTYLKVLLNLLLFCSPCWAAAVDPINQQDPNFINVLNDDLQKINGQQILMNTSYPVSKLSGLVQTSQGGTSADLSAATQGSVPYFSAAGVMSAVGPGVAGQVLTSGGPSANVSWASPAAAYTSGSYLTFQLLNVVQSDAGNSFVKALEIIIPRGGSLTTTFFLSNGTAATTANGRIYRNGVAVGADHQDSTSAGTVYSDTTSGWTAGDLLQLYCHGDGNSGFCGDVELYENTPAKETYNFSSYNTVRTFRCTALATDPPTGLGSRGDLAVRNDGGASTTLYVKTGASTWTAK